MISRFAILAALAIPLCGCETIKGSIAGGECHVFERPEYAVKGKTQYDQNVADNFVESGVGGCNWRRPAARPASLEATSTRKPVAAAKKRNLFGRIKDRAAHPFTSRVAPVVASPPVPDLVLPPMIEPPPKPRDPVDELLHPEGGK
jgi:hypothetical protein